MVSSNNNKTGEGEGTPRNIMWESAGKNTMVKPGLRSFPLFLTKREPENPVTNVNKNDTKKKRKTKKRKTYSAKENLDTVQKRERSKLETSLQPD